VAFLTEVLKVDYAGDDSDSYSVVGESIAFDGISLEYGSEPYEEDWPDYFTTINGGQVGLRYGNNTIAGIYSEQTVTIGFTFETIDTDAQRAELMTRVLELFDMTSSVEAPIVQTFHLGQPYPNPFNAQLTIPFVVESAGLYSFRIYDLRGREVWAEGQLFMGAGSNSLTWQAVNNQGDPVASGSYLLMMETPGGQQLSRSVTVIK
jgi:hypothetical protein